MSVVRILEEHNLYHNVIGLIYDYIIGDKQIYREYFQKYVISRIVSYNEYDKYNYALQECYENILFKYINRERIDNKKNICIQIKLNKLGKKLLYFTSNICPNIFDKKIFNDWECRQINRITQHNITEYEIINDTRKYTCSSCQFINSFPDDLHENIQDKLIDYFHDISNNYYYNSSEIDIGRYDFQYYIYSKYIGNYCKRCGSNQELIKKEQFTDQYRNYEEYKLNTTYKYIQTFTPYDLYILVKTLNDKTFNPNCYIHELYSFRRILDYIPYHDFPDEKIQLLKYNYQIQIVAHYRKKHFSR